MNSEELDFESFFNHFEPFFWAWILDIAAFLLTCLAWFGYSRVLNRTAFWLLILRRRPHAGICSRIYISGRPPVTNLYSSALFIGWGGMVLGMVFEAIFRLGIGNLIASVSGFATLQIAHFLSGDGDTFIVMQAVLDTQFWLATHVVCVTLGYAATFVAGLLGIVYVLRRVHVHAHGRGRQGPGPHDLWHRLLRHVLQLLRHRAGRAVGRRLLGPLLGLGSQGKRGPDHRALECPGAARPLGRHGQRPRPGRAGHGRQHRDGLVAGSA